MNLKGPCTKFEVELMSFFVHFGCDLTYVPLLKREKTEEKLNKGETPSEEVRTVLTDYI